MGSVEALEVTLKQYSDMLPKHFLEDTSMALWTLETLEIQIFRKLLWRQVLTNFFIYESSFEEYCYQILGLFNI